VTVTPRPAAWERTRPEPAVELPRTRLLDYLLLRLTGLVLSVLVLGHFVVTHLVNDVARDDSAFVARRLSSMLWIAWDSLMLAAALAHGATGLRMAIADHAPRAHRQQLQWALAALTSVVFVVGVVAIVRVSSG
jgi:succinate dehydrogenase / fumarate reductase membrane anchor subunit